MITKERLRQEHEEGLRPQRIQRLRAEFREYTDLEPPRGHHDVEEWYRRKKSVITKRLDETTEQTEDSDGTEADE